MTDISVIILVGKEERHIGRCLERLRDLNPRQVFVVESQKGDRTHEVAVETAKRLNWGVRECLNVGIGECLDEKCVCLDRRALAQKKIDEWLVGVDEATFGAALEKLVEEKSAAGEYLFERHEDLAKAKIAAKSFFRDFASRIVELSDGRCVYFAPDPRAKMRNADNALSWAEYAFHAVSSGGDRIPGKNYNYRKYNEYKVANTDLIETTLKSERCVPVLKSKPTQDAVKFFGAAHLGGLFDVVVRLDECGNASANLTEVTFEASSKRGQKKPPQLVSLAEAVRTVVSHQTATGTYPPDTDILANPDGKRKGGGEKECLNVGIGECLDERNIQTFHDSNIQTLLTLVWHDYPGNQAEQFNWALDYLARTNLSDTSVHPPWILRLDADEYLTPDTIEKLKQYLCQPQPPTSGDNVAGLTLELKRRFCGGEIRHGTNGIRQVRLFRLGKARYAETLMDERLVVDGNVVDFPGAFYDDSLMPMSEWREKHRKYAKREAAQAIAGTFQDPRKARYYRLPPYFRAFVYFCIRYFLKGGFLDGYAGWMWNFWQGLWYRWIVDREIARMKKG